jgi:hypothetical protein
LIIDPNFVSLPVTGRNANRGIGIRFKKNWLYPSVAPIYST